MRVTHEPGQRRGNGRGPDATALADLLANLSKDPGRGGPMMSWLSTHPSSNERVEEILAYTRIHKPDAQVALIQASTWNRTKDTLEIRRERMGNGEPEE